MLKKKYTCVKVDQQKDGITWVIFNRPEKRNAMSPTFHREMMEIITLLETDPDTKLVILTGEGTAYSAGQDLKEYFRETDGNPQAKAEASANSRWRNEKLWLYSKPTISMVNGFCIGGAFTHCICADFAIAADDAVFCLSEVNWGILPGGMVSKMVSDTLRPRDAMFYACTGRTFTGKDAARMGLVNLSVPKKNLKKETLKLAKELLGKNPNVLRGTKHAIRATQDMSWRAAADYLNAKGAEIKQRDAARGHDAYAEGIRQFIDEKAYKPVFSPYIGASDGKTTAKGGKPRRAVAARSTTKQAVAKKDTPAKSSATKKAATKKAAAKKTTTRQAASARAAARKSAPRRAAVKKATPRKAAKKAAPRKAAKKAAKKASPRKAAKKASPRKAAKKAAPRKAAKKAPRKAAKKTAKR